MLAYRHAFHAGNHGDVLKHVLLVAALNHLNAKDKPYWVVDTHAGAGGYALSTGYAQQRAEYESGIGRLWSRSDLPPLVRDYVEHVRAFDLAHASPRATGESAGSESFPRQYPGSPELARALLRSQDRLRLFELHPTDHEILAAHFADEKRAKVENRDGYGAIKALLPPPSRRGLVFMDPPYELKTDYPKVLEAVEEGLRRFAHGMFMIWVPALSRREPQTLIDRLKALPVSDWLLASLIVSEPDEGGFGMLGSHVFIVNPPWTLAAQLERELGFLARTLARYPGSHHRLEQRAS
ncbi:MAG: 23S rRNA (adenine(2030)-N(6))-methyltransferase RlmJ [Betaproteobacteria bacterium]|nr:23S rRNA (adenine(2030)-N(6))-methyltransferase RlmJ [Betaproteobacteria bacterium]